ncbi:MAG: tyrosine-type recombinase/integrase, partial [Actinobacteria bacterium]|nr:tyrosine-type recombinase/integrase [Actinomycetota bacterium]
FLLDNGEKLIMYGRRKKLPEILNSLEASKLLSIPNPRYSTGLRNLAMMTVMLNIGLRVSEVTNLKPGHINLTENKLRVVNGKGGVDRDLTIPNGYTSEILKRWKIIKPKSEYFFCTLRGHQVSNRYVGLAVKRYILKAGINKNVSPHSLRHSFATSFYIQSKNLEALRMILGHSNILTTQIYVTLANEEVEAAMNSFNQFVR